MQWAFVQIIAQFPAIVEKYYSNGIYIFISKVLRFTLGWIPFSIGDLIYAFLIIYIIRSIYRAFKKRHFNLKDTLFKIGGVLSIIFFLFHLNWGFNYFREPLFERMNFKKTEVTTNELLDLTNQLIEKVNAIQVQITKNDTLIVNNPLSKKEIKKMTPNAYEALSKKHPLFKYPISSIKHSLFSTPLTYMGFAGYISPLTNEAQVNSLIPKNNYPSTTCHEIAHQLGIASEKEANFVGYLAATNSDDIYFKYSGYLMALRYCLIDIYLEDEATFNQLKTELNKGVLKDIKQSQDFWKSYQNWSEQFFKIFYDSYLKANKQEHGIDGYNKVVLLLINYHLTEEI